MTSHPLLATLERVHNLAEYMETLKLAPEGDGWLPLQALFTPTGETLSEMLGRMGNHYQTENRRVPAALFFGDYAFVLLALASGAYLVDRRVPRLSAESVWVQFDENGYVAATALNDYRFAALEDDPAADHPDCLGLPSTDALQEYLLAQTSACLEPLTQTVRAQAKLGIPAMWALAADYASSATTYVGRTMKDESRALEVARQLSAKKSPLQRKRDFITYRGVRSEL